MMDAPLPHDVLTVRFPDPTGGSAEVEVRGIIDHDRQTITCELPEGTRTTLDVITARALQMILWEGVFGALRPTGPRMSVEHDIIGNVGSH
ncbi:MAG: hypothetical protein J2P15_00900 [Micromonosporaceae bacterium]|nr:hypothetical protein [Micromonosporaceae bacterium]